MMKVNRPVAPNFLKEKYKKWGKGFKARRAIDNNAIFFWTNHENVRINLHLLPILMTMSGEHCSFCDGFPVTPVSSNTIEHFRPKSKYPLLAYAWQNLFYCCSKCQESKLEQFDKKLLKPDVLGYSFEYYFQYEASTGKLVPNPDRVGNDLQRAYKTIELYGLNEHGRPEARKRTVRLYYDSGNPVLEDFPYRFIFQ